MRRVLIHFWPHEGLVRDFYTRRTHRHLLVSIDEHLFVLDFCFVTLLPRRKYNFDLSARLPDLVFLPARTCKHDCFSDSSIGKTNASNSQVWKSDKPAQTTKRMIYHRSHPKKPTSPQLPLTPSPARPYATHPTAPARRPLVPISSLAVRNATASVPYQAQAGNSSRRTESPFDLLPL